MQGEYDKARWFELLRSASLDSITEELSKFPKTFLVNLTDTSISRHICLFYAAQDPNITRGDSLMDLLLASGADPNYKDSLQQTVLFYCSRFGHNNQIEMLISSGADMDQKDNYGQTALFYCAREGHASTVQLIISKGVNVNSVDSLGQTPIFYSCKEGKLETARVLIENGADLAQNDKTRNTPLSWAKRSKNSELVEFLIVKGAQDRSTKKKKQPESRRKPEKRRSEKRIKCQLMVSDETGEKRPASDQEVRQFEGDFPEIAKYWLNPETLEELDTLDQETIDSYRPWEKPAKKLLNVLWRSNNAWVFHEKVDPEALGIPDYFDIVKTPMDFGTIKKKLNSNVYSSMREFLDDFELVFYNCRLYNPPGSNVYPMCVSLQTVYENQFKALEVAKYLKDG